MIVYHSVKHETTMMLFQLFNGELAPDFSMYVLFSGYEADAHLKDLIFNSEHQCTNVNNCYC
jgi:hypothetical protein